VELAEKRGKTRGIDWHISNLVAGREAATKLIREAPIPASARELVAAEIAALPADCTGVKIVAHGRRAGGMADIQISVLGLTARRW
jgi:hypothetical protein